jgi:flavin reductase (DIM6/NTAB) family NADH-FMN oxidoreductase RutF
MTFKEISPYELNDNVFTRIGKQWMLVAAAKPDGSINAMTAAWGGLGFIWQCPVAFVFIRPQRCTKTFVDAASGFSLSFLPSEYRDALNFMGNVSGFDDPKKVEHSGLLIDHSQDSVPYFSESELVLVCERIYQQDMQADSFTKEWPLERYYTKTDGAYDLHCFYIAAIKQVLIKQ